MNISNLAKNVGQTLSNNSPVILTGMAVAGTVSSAILSAKGGMQARVALEERDNELLESGVEDRTRKEEFIDDVKTTWKFYIPAGLMTGATVACVIGAHSINNRRNAAIMTAYSLTDRAFQEYKEHIVETIGEKKEQAAREELGKKHLDNNPVTQNTIILGEGDHLCYDQATGRYFNSTMEKIRRAVNDINERCISQVYASHNDFYEHLGLPPIGLGEELGWRDTHLMNVSFSTHLTSDAKPCLVLDYTVGPVNSYYRESRF